MARTTLAWWLQQTAATLDAVRDDGLERNEVWSLVTSKANQRWAWIALCRRTRQVVACFSGDRTEASDRKLWERRPDACRDGRAVNNFWSADQNVFATGNHRAVGKEHGETNHVERWNTALRPCLARFMRKPRSFSSSDLSHEVVWRLFIIRSNLECVS